MGNQLSAISYQLSAIKQFSNLAISVN